MTVRKFCDLCTEAKVLLTVRKIKSEEDQVLLDSLLVLLKGELTTHNAEEIEKILEILR